MTKGAQRAAAKPSVIDLAGSDEEVESEDEYEQSGSGSDDADEGSEDDASSSVNGSASDDDFQETAKQKSKPSSTKAAKSKASASKDAPPPKKPKTASAKEAPTSTKHPPPAKAPKTTTGDLRTVPPDHPACAPRVPSGEQKSSAVTADKPSAAASSSKPAIPPPASKVLTKAAASSSSQTPASAPASTGDGVLDFLRKTSAPTNAQGIADHFRNQISKGEAERRCADLVARGLAETREGGNKVKLFWASQKGVKALTPDKEGALKQDIQAARAQRAGHSLEIEKLQQAMKSMKSRRSIDEVRSLIDKRRATSEELGVELEAMRKEQGGGAPMTPAEATKVKKDYMRLRKIYLDRRRTCLELLGNMGEAMGKSEKQLMEELGLETDADYGVDKSAFPVLF